MPNNLQKIKVTEPQEIWLGAICSKLQKGEQVSARGLKVELRDKLPRDFHPSDIDTRLLRSEDKITLLGIGLLDPDSERVDKANRVLQSIRDFLLRSHEAKVIGLEPISNKTKLPEEEVAHMFKELSYLGIFHDSGYNYGHGVDGWLAINVDERTFDSYLKYESIDQILDAFIEGRSALIKELSNYASRSGGDEAPSFNPPPVASTNPNLDIFISHSSEDEKVAEALADLFKNALNLPAKKIRCTSVPAYKLEPGATVEETLRREIDETRVFIGLITPASVKSTYVLFELGARWGAGADRSLIPVLASGADYSYLHDPLKNRNPIRCEEQAEVRDLIDVVASILGVAPDRQSAYQKWVDELVRKSKPKREKRQKHEERASSISGSIEPNMNALKSELEDLKKYKLILELVTGWRDGDVASLYQSSVSLFHSTGMLDKPTPEEVSQAKLSLIKADLRIRLENNDLQHNIPMRGVWVSLMRKTSRGKEEEIPLVSSHVRAFEDGTGERIAFDSVTIGAGRQTPPYDLQCQFQLDAKHGKRLDRKCFLRITMKAASQPPYVVDCDADWAAALDGVVPVTLRK
jgi:hypothetical protein